MGKVWLLLSYLCWIGGGSVQADVPLIVNLVSDKDGSFISLNDYPAGDARDALRVICIASKSVNHLEYENHDVGCLGNVRPRRASVAIDVLSLAREIVISTVNAIAPSPLLV